MNSIAVFAPLIVKSFRGLNDDEKQVISDITNDLNIKSYKKRYEERELQLNETIIKLKEERDKEIEKEKEREQREKEKEKEREREREKEKEKEKEKEELKNEINISGIDTSLSKSANGNISTNANAKKANNNDESSNTGKAKKKTTKGDTNDEKASKKENNETTLKKNFSKASLKNNKEMSFNSMNEISVDSSKVFNNENNEKLLALNKNYKSKLDLELIKEDESVITELNNTSANESVEEEDIGLNIKNLEQQIEENEENLRKLIKKKKKINSIKKLSYNDYMFVDPLQYPKSVITIERRTSPTSSNIEHINNMTFDLSKNISSSSSSDENETPVNEKQKNNKNSKNDKCNDNTENNENNDTILSHDSSLPYIIPLKESNTSLNHINSINEDDTEKNNLENSENNDYFEENDDCNEMFLMGYPRLHDYPHKHLFQNQKYRDKQRYFKMLKEKRNHKNGKYNNVKQKFIQTQNRTNIKLKKKYPFQEKKEDDDIFFRNYHPLLRNFQLQQMNAKMLYQQELDKNNNKSDSLNSSLNSLYREEINELSKSMVPTSPSRRNRHRSNLPSKETYNIENFEKDTSSNNKTKVFYDNNKKITISSDEEDENDSSSKEFEDKNYSSSSSDYYRKKTESKRKRKIHLPVNKRVNHLLNKCTSLKKINTKSPLSKLNQHLIAICKNDNETEEDKLLNNIECYKIMQNKKNQRLLMTFRLRQLGVGINYKQYLAYMKTKNENKKYELEDLEKIQFREYKNCVRKFIEEQESKVKAPRVVQGMISSKMEEVEPNSDSSESEKQEISDDGDEYLEMDKPEVREARRELFKRIPCNEGRGYSEYLNGNVYYGEFENNLMNGIGRYKWNNGLIYEGEFLNNSINGIGRYKWNNSNVYVGNIDNFIRNGYGEYINNECKKNYTGEWKNGKLNGYGILKYDPEGKSYYEGEWLNNKKHGKGKMVYKSGNIYTGNWKNNMKDGFGKMEFKDKNEEYIGFWKDNLPNGKGIYTWNKDSPLNCQYPYHNQYEGDWDNGKKWGHGIFRYSSGAIYDGEWFDNMKHGVGIYITEYGYIYDGVFKYDRTTEPFEYYNNDNQHFFDISLIYDDEKRRMEQLRSLNIIIIRYIFELNEIYLKYRNYQPKENSIYQNYSLSYIQLWKLLEDCEISKTTNYSLVEMNREYAKIFKDKKYLNYKFNELHNEDLHLTLHDFYEYLIHVSYLLYSKVEIPSINEDGVAVCFSHFIKNNILAKTKNMSDNNNLENLGSIIFQKIKDKYRTVIYDIYKDRSYYHKNSLENSKGDLTLNMRDIIYILNDYNILDDEVLTLNKIIQIFATYFIPGINEDGIFNFDYELLPYEFIRFIFYCILVKYCPNDNYIKSKRSKLYNESVIQSKLDLDKSEEGNSINNIKMNESNINIPNTANSAKTSNGGDNKKAESGLTEKSGIRKGTAVEPQDNLTIKNKNINLSAQKKKQISNMSTNENPEKPEPTPKNVKKTSNNPQSSDDKNEDNKKGNHKGNEVPNSGGSNNSTSNNSTDNNGNANNENSEEIDSNSKTDMNNVKFNVESLKYKFFEFGDNEDPIFIIDTFVKKLLNSKKDDDNEIFVKAEESVSDSEDEEENKKEKESNESVISVIDKLDPEIQEWMIEDIDNFLDTFSAKLEFFKKRDENQRLALQNYEKDIRDKQLALKQLKEEQMNLNRKLQHEIKNAKWVLENMSKFDEVTNEVSEISITDANPSQTIGISQQNLSHQSSQQQMQVPTGQPNVASNYSLANPTPNNQENINYPQINITK